MQRDVMNSGDFLHSTKKLLIKQLSTHHSIKQHKVHKLALQSVSYRAFIALVL